jgi:hypothetical protein
MNQSCDDVLILGDVGKSPSVLFLTATLQSGLLQSEYSLSYIPYIP